VSENLVASALASCAARLGDDATAVLSRLAGPLGDDVRAAARALAALDAATAKHRRAEVAALARSPALAAIRRIDHSWLEAALVELPERARTAVDSPPTNPTDVWLARWALSSIPPQVDQRPPDVLLAWLRSIALDQLALALGPQAATASAPPALRAAVARITRPPRLDALGPARAALVRCRDATLDDESSLLAIAGRALAPHLASQPLAILALTRRLPYPQGSLLERELVAHAATPLDQVPTWDALVAS